MLHFLCVVSRQKIYQIWYRFKSIFPQQHTVCAHYTELSGTYTKAHPLPESTDGTETHLTLTDTYTGSNLMYLLMGEPIQNG